MDGCWQLLLPNINLESNWFWIVGGEITYVSHVLLSLVSFIVYFTPCCQSLPTPEFGPHLICLHRWLYYILILVCSSGQRAIGGANVDCTVSKEMPYFALFWCLCKRRGKTSHLIQKPNLIQRLTNGEELHFSAFFSFFF